MFQNGLLILTQPLALLQPQISRLVQQVSAIVTNTLYVHLQPRSNNGSRFRVQPLPCTKEVQQFIRSFYSCGFSSNQHLDIRVVLGHITNNQLQSFKYPTTSRFNVIITDSNPSFKPDKETILKEIAQYFTISSSDVPLQVLNEISSGREHIEETSTGLENNSATLETYKNVVLGGTFDRLHVGHKILLSEGCLFTEQRLTVGVSNGDMNNKKVLHELMEPSEKRKESVLRFISDVKPAIQPDVVTITDAYGPTIVDPDFQCIVLSDETVKGGNAVNKERSNRGMSELEQVAIELVADQQCILNEESKVSSSSQRKRLLGVLLQPVLPRDLDSSPYRIGLTGGIASGKSAIVKRLSKLGAAFIDCDKLGHETYKYGTETYHQILNEFGDDIVDEKKEIDRKKLGPIVFSDKTKLSRLNEIVWPSILDLAEAKVAQFKQEGQRVVVFEAAILLEAGWDRKMHEVWTTVIPRDEAVIRLVDRNGLTEKDALARLDNQMSNKARITKSNVVFCSLWEPEYTQLQCEKAWEILMARL